MVKRFLMHYLLAMMLFGFCRADEFHLTNIQMPSVQLFLSGGQRASAQHVTFCDQYKHHSDIFFSPSLHNYTADQLQYYFNHRQCSEEEILDQSVLYLSDEFVKCAKRYAGYELAIEKLHRKFIEFGLLKKVLHTFTGTYSPGLEKRISQLYREIQLRKLSQKKKNIENVQQTQSNQRDQEYLLSDAQIAEYEQLKPVYEQYCPSLARAIEQRMVACNSGKQLQYALHQESIAILEKIKFLLPSDVLYPHQNALIDCASAIDEYNREGFVDKAACIADFCWTLFDYGKAITEGAVLGLYATVQDLIEHPIEATVCIVAGKQVLAYQLCKVLYNVADIGLTAITDYDGAKEKWDDYIKPLSNIIAAIENKEIALRDILKVGTAFVVGYKAQSKLLGGLGTFCRTIKQKTVRFAQNNSSSFTIQQYLATPEGYLLRSVAKSTCSARCPNQYEHLKQWLRIKEFTAVIKTSRHGIERLIERDFTPEEVWAVMHTPTFVKKQTDGAFAYVKQIEKKFNVIIFNQQNEEVVTVLKHTNQKKLDQMGKNYGW